ncbi:hypothetical protein ASPNIDRAFT_128882 [Aspergillus niger ATCC 1015]|uniref:Major facilitator superfamily (MFS) profile domain-containing protein n=1 Tax=Aspergillus niger (strain ATCC 1015 / CBS 113.46 / FGSC A1144 / LSHB Ac4 / NCTC 3858a / NRRL 328 / USDA 3528.7) TaxID=380704 RepID=G3XUQ3_ASPNA|nr:hypothetical protein ASPNIDRAFT_128882 [Aspergillus niger ATCC 1015]
MGSSTLRLPRLGMNHGGKPSDKSYASESQSTAEASSLREMLETEAEGETCDRLLPVCTACIEAKAKCCPRSVQLGGTAEDASGLSNAALPDYIETLKRKVEALDDQSRRQRRRAAQNSPQTSHDTPLTEQTSLTERSVQAAMGEIEFLSRNAMAEPRGEASGFPQELAIGSMIQASLTISGKDPTQSLSSLSQKSKYSTILGQAPTLTRDVVAMDRFFGQTKALCPFIDEEEMLGYRDSFFDSSQESQATPYTSFRDFNVYMAAAIGILLSPDSGIEFFASSLHSAAMQKFPSIIQSNDDMSMLHSLLLLIIYSMFSSVGGSTWHLLGLAMKKAISYGFHKEPLYDIGIPEEKLTRRRGIFWNLYILDRSVLLWALECSDLYSTGLLAAQWTAHSVLKMKILRFRYVAGILQGSSPDALDFPAYVVMHARLMSKMRGSSPQQSIFHYGSLSYWRDIPRGIQKSSVAPASSRAIRQLTCRAMVCLAQISGLEQAATRVLGTTHTIRQDVINTCNDYINTEYLAVEDDCFTGSFVDAFDIFSVGVVLICLGRTALPSEMSNATSVLNECTALLTLLGERFPALKAFCRVLWCLQESADMNFKANHYSLCDTKMAPSRDDDLVSSRQTTADKPTVYLLDTFPPEAIEHAKTLFNIIQPQDEEFQNWRQDARALLIRSSYLTAEDVASCPNLIAIGKHGVGIDKIDQAACAERGIKILNTPGANARDVAELVIALSLSVARGIRSITTRQMSKPVPKETCKGLTLYQKTVGIIGMGNIGRTVAEIFRGGFETDIIAYDAYMPDDIWTHIPHARANSIDEVITRADILSIHVPLTNETRDMISYDKICMMKPDAILINAARGGIVNEQDLTRALSEGHLWGAGLDCHEQEPPSFEKYDFSLQNPPPNHPPTMPPHNLHIPLNTIRNEQRPPILSAKRTVRQILPPILRSDNPRLRHPLPIHHKHTSKTRMTDKQTPLFVHRQPIRPCTPKRLEEQSHFRQFCLVMATYKNRSSGDNTNPFGDIPFDTRQSSLPSGESRYTHPDGSVIPVWPWSTGPSRKISDAGRAEPLRHSVGWPVHRRVWGACRLSRYWLLKVQVKMGLITETRKAIQDAPKGMFNAYVLMCTCVFAFAGVAKGFDEEDYADTKGWIVSITTAGAVFGCLVQCPRINDRLGRRWTFRLSTLIYIAGILGQGLCNGNLSGLYASRFIAGLGLGVLTIVPPIYISEIAPKTIRGLLTLQHAACQQLGVVFGFFINYGVTKSYPGGDKQWMLPTLLQLLPATIWLVGSFLCCESPRWLLYKGKRHEAATNLVKLRHLPLDHPIIVAELAGMDAQLLLETESVGEATIWELLKETLTPIENRRRFFLIFMANLFSQWSGANAITQYSPTIFGYLGISGEESTFLATGIYGVVKFASTLAFALFIVDFIGRRRSLITGICLQIVTLVYVGAYLGATKDMTSTQIRNTPSAAHASTAAIVAIYIHAVAWSIGWFGIPYLIGSEIFPIRIRSLNVSISMAFHWAFYFGCSRAMPSLLAATHRWGAFLFFGCICLSGLVYVFFAMPDTTGRSLEALDSLFQRPWYTVYRVAYPSSEAVQVEREDAKA